MRATSRAVLAVDRDALAARDEADDRRRAAPACSSARDASSAGRRRRPGCRWPTPVARLCRVSTSGSASARSAPPRRLHHRADRGLDLAQVDLVARDRREEIVGLGEPGLGRRPRRD